MCLLKENEKVLLKGEDLALYRLLIDYFILIMIWKTKHLFQLNCEYISWKETVSHSGNLECFFVAFSIFSDFQNDLKTY